ncbi:MAG: serine hydrolase [Eubacteriales bacterium]|nr:serine hydrolase [Eubacteriales bacterium]
MSESLLHALPCQAGVDPNGILHFLDDVESQELALHGLMVLRHNKVVAEGWWAPYQSAYNHMLFSLSKSFTSTAVGFAVQEGLVSLDDPILKFFPGKLPAAPCENMQKMKVRHLIGMCTGHIVEPSFHDQEDWVYTFLASYVPLEPGSKFLYNTAATYMLSAILQTVTGQKVSEYLRPRLLEPLGIENVWWETCPKGYETGGFGFNIKTEDIARFGTFLLNRGAYNGRQLIDAAWIDEATARHISNGDPSVASDWTQGYAYQFWRCQPEGVYRADGAFGQYCIVMPKQDAVIAINSGLNNLQGVLDLVWKHLVPAMRDDAVCDKAVNDRLKARLAALRLAMPQGTQPTPNHAGSGVHYHLVDNRFGLTGIRFDFGAQTTFTLEAGEKSFALPVGHDRWVETHVQGSPSSDRDASGFSLPFSDVACAGAWKDGCYRFCMAYTRTPFVDTLEARFSGNALVLRFQRNVGFDAEPIVFCGLCE